ncbi:MAG: phosphoesterase, partial [Phenylobacterium sp.]|nr:phosphoesterase [Phenylobacterium sp.]
MSACKPFTTPRLPALAAASILALAAPALAHETGARHDGHGDGLAWLAGDHHVHSQFSVDWKPGADPSAPPEPVIGGDSNNTIPTNARMARKYGLSWMAATDHGGPNHSRVNRDLAYPEVLKARREVPDLILFFGLELNTPGADHSSIIVPNSPQERDDLTDLERRFDKFEAWPVDPARDQEGRMVEALTYMKALPRPPVVIAHHPSRSAKGLGQYGQTTPAELRDWNDAAPQVSVGMEGAPGHQAAGLN